MEKANRPAGRAEPRKAPSADLIVVGSGSSGLAAALTAAEGGARTIIFEKTERVGGSSNLTGGPFAVESSMQRSRYITATRDEVFRFMMEYSHWRADPRLARAFIDRSAGTIEWLQERGVEFTDNHAPMFAEGYHTCHHVKGHGSHLVGVLAARTRQAGGEIRVGTRVTRIERKGHVLTGVTAVDREGKPVTVHAKTVVIATGGYGSNRDMVREHTGYELGVTLFQRVDLDLTGDGILMAWEAGAAPEGMGLLMLQYGVPGPGLSGSMLPAVARQPYLWVNYEGRRFCDETVSGNWPFAGNALNRQKPGCRYAYLIFDAETRRYLEEEGLDNRAGDLMPGTKVANLDAEIAQAQDEGNANLFVTASLKELAVWAGINGTELRKTVKEYNRCCEKGHDDVFVKNPRYLRPVSKAPFYVFRLFPFFLATLGGIRINEKTEVLNREHCVIPGLYAVGNDAGGLHGDSYDLYLSGTPSGFAVNSGRIAGEQVLRYLGLENR